MRNLIRVLVLLLSITVLSQTVHASQAQIQRMQMLHSEIMDFQEQMSDGKHGNPFADGRLAVAERNYGLIGQSIQDMKKLDPTSQSDKIREIEETIVQLHGEVESMVSNY